MSRLLLRRIAYAARTTFVSAAIAAGPSTLLAQDEPIVLDDDAGFDLDLGFDDPFSSAFDAPFADELESAESAPAWLGGFTVKLSQQVLFQTRTHMAGVSTPDGQRFDVPHRADVETNRLGANIRYQYAFAPGWLLQASAQARAFLHDDYEFEANDQAVDTEFRLNEFFIQRSFGAHSVKLGNQTVVWGEVDGNSVLDVINITEFRDFSIIDIEDARLNQPMLVWDYFGDAFGERSQVSTFVTLYPEYNPPIVRGSPFFSEPPNNITDFKRGESLDFEGGVKWSRSFAGSDISVMAARLIENQLRYSAPANPSDDALSRNNQYTLLGVSGNRAFGMLLVNLDLAYSRGIVVNNFNIPGVSALAGADQRRDQIGASVGLEYAIDNEQNIALSAQAIKPIDDAEIEGLPTPPSDVTGVWLLRYSNSLMNGDLALAFSMQGDIDAQYTILQASADRTVNDHWAAGVNLILLEGVDTSPISLFEGDVRIGFNVTYSF